MENQKATESTGSSNGEVHERANSKTEKTHQNNTLPTRLPYQQVRFSNTLPLSSLIKSSSFACLASSIARSISVSVMLAAVMVSGPVLLVPPGGDWWGLEFCRSLVSFNGLPRPYVLLFTVALSDWSRAIGLLFSTSEVSGSMSDSITYALFCFDGDLVNRPSGPLGPIPLLLLQS